MIEIGRNAYCRIPDVRDRLKSPHADAQIAQAIISTAGTLEKQGHASLDREANAAAAAELLNSGEPIPAKPKAKAKKK